VNAQILKVKSRIRKSEVRLIEWPPSEITSPILPSAQNESIDVLHTYLTSTNSCQGVNVTNRAKKQNTQTKCRMIASAEHFSSNQSDDPHVGKRRRAKTH
jgi:hypothetical protein